MKTYNLLCIFFNIMENIKKYNYDTYILDCIDNLEEPEIVFICFLYHSFKIKQYGYAWRGNFKKESIEYFYMEHYKEKIENKELMEKEINNEKIKSCLMCIIDRIYNARDIPDSAKDKLNFIISKIILKI